MRATSRCGLRASELILFIGLKEHIWNIRSSVYIDGRPPEQLVVRLHNHLGYRLAEKPGFPYLSATFGGTGFCELSPK